MVELKLVLMLIFDIICLFNKLIIECLLCVRFYVGFGVK